MPRPPHVSGPVAGIKGSVYSKLLHRLLAHRGEVYPFHVGDTYLSPPSGCTMEEIRAADHPDLNRYTPPQGLPALVDAALERVRARTGVPLEKSRLFITGGATAGLANAVGAVASSGDEVLLLAPHWPLIDGICRTYGAIPVDVPFFGVVDSPEAATRAVEAKTSSRTVALYVNTPNNPTGRVVPRSWLEALVDWARRKDLWLFFDEVYEDFQYEGTHVSGLSLAPERAFAAYSLSKGFGMAGYRCGWLAGPAAPMEGALKLHTHNVYSAPTASQVAALRVLGGVGEAWVASARAAYAGTGRRAAARLGVPAPEGSTFLFLDVAAAVGGGGLGAFLEGCADDGVFAAPGPSFGPYPTHLRVCYTAAPPDVVMRGVEILARRLGRN
ncbi:MAG TPA: pyridoxal phosphate-dependent aminotransferase [Thermoanaerobaculia bacterium]|nr:pyridoxal phosphate-dependent aminotransferase [Thermoanaerobaculia bacterium]